MFGSTHRKIIGINLLIMCISFVFIIIHTPKITIFGVTEELGFIIIIGSMFSLLALTNGVMMVMMILSMIFPGMIKESEL